MRCRISRVVLAAALGLFTVSIERATAEEPFDTVARYTEALRAGDTAGIKACLGGRLYEKRVVLLDENEEYPDFLTKRYDGAKFFISGELTDLGAQGQGIRLEISFPSGHFSKSLLVVERGSGGVWKIVDEVEANP